MVVQILIKLAILIVGSLLISSVLRVFTKNAFVWSLVPKRYKRILVFLASCGLYAVIWLGPDLLWVLGYAFISTFLSFYFYKQESRFKKHIKEVMKK